MPVIRVKRCPVSLVSNIIGGILYYGNTAYGCVYCVKFFYPGWVEKFYVCVCIDGDILWVENFFYQGVMFCVRVGRKGFECIC
jgi:hypothetical protein